MEGKNYQGIFNDLLKARVEIIRLKAGVLGMCQICLQPIHYSREHPSKFGEILKCEDKKCSIWNWCPFKEEKVKKFREE